ncbi:MAG: phosphate ABC transporter permease PstA [Xanthomonadaceae bacterium]|nr:phosphate ABC transporter permease PstA [Xanthomonadaceae bacterium]
MSGSSAADIHMSRKRAHRRRKRINAVGLALSMLAMGFGVFWLSWILLDTVRLGVEGLSLAVFTEMTPPPNADSGGLANAIAGSALMVAVATLLGTPVGVLSGIYLSEYGQQRLLARITRFVNDILLSAPSIVIGLFVYSLIVVPFKGFSGWAGAVALALIMIPIVVRTTENILRLIPDSLREAAYALGTPKWKVVMLVVMRTAKAGVTTGALLALARVSGETAPLLFTALSNQFWSMDLSEPMANLPVTIFKFAMSPFENWQKLAWAGVFVITVSVLFLNIVTRVIMRKKN